MKKPEMTMIKFKDRAPPMSPDRCPIPVELRFAIDTADAPLAYPAVTYPDPEITDQLEVEISGHGLLATLVLPIADARAWAGKLFAAVSAAYREATGDPHALSDHELAGLPPADRYHPGPGVVVIGDDDTPARVRFHLIVDIAGHCLSTADLRASLVEHLAGRFNVTRVAVSQGEPRAGSVH